MTNRRAILAAAGVVVIMMMAVVTIRYAGLLRDVPMAAAMTGYMLGSVSAWVAARDWSKKTGKPEEGRGKA